MSDIIIPSVPSKPTEGEVQFLQLEYARIGLELQRAAHREHLAALEAMETKQQQRHQAAMEAAAQRHTDNQAQADITALRLALAVQLGGSKTPAEISAVAEDLWPMIGLEGAALPGAPTRPPTRPLTPNDFAPLPSLVPTEIVPPVDVAPEHLPWYLAGIAPELRAYGLQATLESAQGHYKGWGRAQQRKWAPDAPAPFWGPGLAVIKP